MIEHLVDVSFIGSLTNWVKLKELPKIHENFSYFCHEFQLFSVISAECPVPICQIKAWNSLNP